MMKKLSAIVTNCFLLVMLCILWSCQKSKDDLAENTVKPNIIWIIAEDLSQDLGCYGVSAVQTPNIDGLAENGVKFTNVFTTAPVCTPSRTAFITGMYQTSINAYHMRYPDKLKNDLPEGMITINEIFRKNGYVTAHIKDAPGNNKTDWSFNVDMSAQYDFSYWHELAEQDKPFFAQINSHNTHRKFVEDTTGHINKAQIKIPPYYPDNAVVREDWANYYNTVEVLDKEVGNILDTLQNLGLLENTIVLFFSDHGRPMTRGKMWNYDSGLEIPLIAKFFGAAKMPAPYQPNESADQLISAIDITATTMALAGIEIPDWMEGEVFWGENRNPEREYVFSATDRIGEIFFKSRSVRSKKYRYIRNYRHDFSVNSASTFYRKGNHPIYHVLNILKEKNALNDTQMALVEDVPYEELYDLENDPYEIHNLASEADCQNDLKKMQNVLDKWIKDTDDKGMQEDSEELTKAFEDYGIQSEKLNKEKIQKLHQEVLEALEKDNPL